MEPQELIEFMRIKEYRFVRDLGEGACGRTVLLRDESVGIELVCKKFTPIDDSDKPKYFENFRREIQLLYDVYHANVCRIFTHYLYPEHYAGYILMEYVPGNTIADYVKIKPDTLLSVFLQTIEGFAHLQGKGILHRDIRPENILVRSTGEVKIIDLGFGKAAPTPSLFKKSVSLNWAFERPAEFHDEVYDFRTEIYFVGRLFEWIVNDLKIEEFKYAPVLHRMTTRNQRERTSSFSAVLDECQQIEFSRRVFSDDQKTRFRAFTNEVCEFVSGFTIGTTLSDDIMTIVQSLKEVYESSALDEEVADPHSVIRALATGGYKYRRGRSITVDVLLSFIRLIEQAAENERKLILSNLHSRLNAIEKYWQSPPSSDDIPF